MKKINTFLKRIILIIVIFMMISTSIIPTSEGAGKVKLGDDEFYYQGTTEATYVPYKGLFSWLNLNWIGDLIDWIIGIATMGVRMVFVGWTALIEQILTWTFERTVAQLPDSDMILVSGSTNNAPVVYNGVTIPPTGPYTPEQEAAKKAMEKEQKEAQETISSFLSGKGSTFVTDIENPNDNLTVEAIVYNRVPIFNINVFKQEYDETVSGTGLKMYCEECDAPIGECQCTDCKCNSDACKLEKQYVCTTCGKTVYDCTCTTCTCNACQKHNQPQKGNMVLLVKRLVSLWYYIIRLIAIIAMLLVLIFIGIKMAITSIASDRAVYKRMLIDWLVGMIILFFSHYIMLTCININETLVRVIENTNPGLTQIEEKEYTDKVKSNAQLEISIYEEVRTRAYDAKMINGTLGMIMYISLVFMAFRYSIIYLKRYITIIILTLMAPGVALSYAFQKALTGKSPAFSKWLGEYFLNCFIQTVHALIYTVFITTALIISLNSFAGMILAIILMNHMKDAEALFKKIFKIASGANLAEDVAKSGSLKDIKSKAVGAYLGAKPLANIVKSTPPMRALKFAKESATGGAVIGIANLKDKWDNSSIKASLTEGVVEIGTAITQITMPDTGGVKDDKIDKYNAARQRVKENLGLVKPPVGDLEKYAERERTTLAKAIAGETSWKEYEKVKKEYKRQIKLNSTSTGKMVKAHIDKLFDMNNYYYKDKDGKRRRYKKFGVKYNERTQKYEVSTSYQMVKEQLSAENLLGFSEKDKETFKTSAAFFKKGLVGMGAMFVGLGTVVETPSVGLPLLGMGIMTQSELFGRNGRSLKGPSAEKKRYYTFGGFARGSVGTIANAAEAMAINEQNGLVVKNVKENHSKLYNVIRKGGGITIKGAIGIGAVGTAMSHPYMAAAVAGAIVPTLIVGSSTKYFADNLVNNIFSKVEEADKSYLKQNEKKIKDFKKDEISYYCFQAECDYRNGFAELVSSIEASNVEENNINIEENISIGNAVQTEDGNVIFTRRPANLTNVKKTIGYEIANMALKNGQISIKELSLSSQDMNYLKKVIKKQLIASGTLGVDDSIDDVLKNFENMVLTVKAEMENKERNNNNTSESGEKTERIEGVSEKLSAILQESDANKTFEEKLKQNNLSITPIEEAILEDSIQKVIEDTKANSLEEIKVEDVAEVFERRKVGITYNNILERANQYFEQNPDADEERINSNEGKMKQEMAEIEHIPGIVAKTVVEDRNKVEYYLEHVERIDGIDAKELLEEHMELLMNDDSKTRWTSSEKVDSMPVSKYAKSTTKIVELYLQKIDDINSQINTPKTKKKNAKKSKNTQVQTSEQKKKREDKLKDIFLLAAEEGVDKVKDELGKYSQDGKIVLDSEEESSSVNEQKLQELLDKLEEMKVYNSVAGEFKVKSNKREYLNEKELARKQQKALEMSFETQTTDKQTELPTNPNLELTDTEKLRNAVLANAKNVYIPETREERRAQVENRGPGIDVIDLIKNP